MAQRIRAACARIELVGEPADSGVAERVPTTHVTRPAGPKKILGSCIFLVAVDVADFNGAIAATETTDSRTRRRAGVRPVA